LVRFQEAAAPQVQVAVAIAAGAMVVAALD
jgi:hypothetical protein